MPAANTGISIIAAVGDAFGFESQLRDDIELLKLIVRDGDTASPLYRPGPYWKNATRSAVNELRRCGISDFRGQSCGAAAGFSDYIDVDRRLTSNYGLRRVLNSITRVTYPLNRIYDSQVVLTATHTNELIEWKRAHLQNHPRVLELIRKYRINFDTTRGGDRAWLELGGHKYSFHYLELLSTLDYISEDVPLSNTSRFFEIGGGFGANAHLVIELFGVRKIIYLDVAPNLYVGTQYLKSFYGSAVRDYRSNKHCSIRFSNTPDLEIICILPPQIEQIETELDVFHNAHSFVEMPESVVENYARFINERLRDHGSFVSLVTYDWFDPQTTFHPNRLLKYFSGEITEKIFDQLGPKRSNLHYMIVR